MRNFDPERFFENSTVNAVLGFVGVVVMLGLLGGRYFV